MALVFLLKRLIGIAIILAVIGFGYHYLKNRGVTVPGSQVNPTSGIQGAQNAVQQSQNYQNQINQKAAQYAQ